MGDVSRIGGLPPPPGFDPSKPSRVPTELINLVKEMRSAYKSGSLKRIKNASSAIGAYLQMPDTSQELARIAGSDLTSIKALIHEYLDASERIHNLAEPPAGFPLDAKPSHPELGPQVLAVGQFMTAQVIQRNSLMKLLNAVDPQTFSPPIHGKIQEKNRWNQ